MDYIFDSSLVLYLPLPELDSGSFMSRDAYGHHCTNYGALWTPGGRNFDGSDDYVDTGGSAVLKTTSEISILAWIKSSSSATGGYVSNVGNDPVSGRAGYDLGVEANKIRFRVGVDAPTNYDALWSNVAPSGGWDFIAARHDGNYLRLSINLIECTPVAASQFPYNAGPVNTFIGKCGFGSFSLVTIGCAWIYTRALTKMEIQNICLATKWRYQ